MYNIKLDKNNFFTGEYASVGIVENGIDIDTLPPLENSKAYKYINKKWVLDANKLNEIKNEELINVKNIKKNELGNICTKVIENGFDVKLSDGITYHFSLEPKDQTAIMSNYSNAINPDYNDLILWHPDNGYCTIYSKEDMITITKGAITHRTYNETLINHLNRYIESLTSESDINEVVYSPDSLKGESLEKFNHIIELILS